MPEQKIIFSSYLFPKSSAFTATETNGALNKLIHFQFLPTIDTDSSSASYTNVSETLGRAEQINIFKDSQNRGLSLTTTFVADGEIDPFSGGPNIGGHKIRDEFWVQHQVNRLIALTKPIYDRETISTKGGKFFAPPLVLFTHGVKFVNVPVVVESVNVKDVQEGAIEGATALPQIVEVTINMKTNYPYGFVPGYLNLHKTFFDARVIRGSRKYEGYLGENFGVKNMTFDGTVHNVLDDTQQEVSATIDVPLSERQEIQR